MASSPPAPTVDCAFAFQKEHSVCHVVDLRSPVEFKQGHVPGAVNIPILDDSERALVGTLYKQAGSAKAVEAGLDIFNRKASAFIHSFSQKRSAPILIYCWRGGMRSSLTGQYLSSMQGIQNIHVLKGGYKSFRKSVSSLLDKLAAHPLLVVNGLSGSGKTSFVELVRDNGLPAINLEKLACHRGSAFGGMAQLEAPPTVSNFENNIAREYFAIQDARRIFLEIEDRIGNLYLPQGLRKNIMTNASMVYISRPLEERAGRIAKTYSAQWNSQHFAECLLPMDKYLSHAQRAVLLEAAERADFLFISRELLKNRYDAQYNKILQRHESKCVERFDFGGDRQVAEALEFVKRNVL